MKPSKFIELLWKWVKMGFTGRVVIEWNQGGIRAVEQWEREPNEESFVSIMKMKRME